MDVTELAGLLHEAEEHHGAYEAVAPVHHWWDWYAAYIVARDGGSAEDQAVAEAGRHMEAVLR
ncbi:bleomycin resistance protein [Modestobacter excelsi]|uniref:bleomycin resistance protein n=1 Tax=Modestobacter excelsi TaxID=2213161 RepID=UPI00110CE5E8|nr:bleomycin resistance protein [Modestobacter excelsi]